MHQAGSDNVHLVTGDCPLTTLTCVAAIFGSERSLRGADVVGGFVGLWVCQHDALKLI